MSWAAAAAGMQVAGGLASFFGSKSAAKQAERLTRSQLWAHDADTVYNRGVLEREQAMERGMALAQWGASNLKMVGTAKTQLTAVDQQLSAEMRNFEDMALAQRRSIRYGGKAQASSIRNQGIASLLGAGGSAAGYMSTVD